MQKILLDFKYGWYITYLTFKYWKKLIFSPLDFSEKNLYSWLFWDNLRHYSYTNKYQIYRWRL